MASNPIFALLWLVLLWFVAWPVAGFCAFVWILLQPFEACFPTPVKSINNFLEKLVTWPRDLGHAIKNCQSSCPSPF
ncbi:hypothetical protein IV203_035863 [Nitzschia inconspicua]|uniref:Uncharacterized protein n=1 Tax=Nitzschia inconspicua TaxID=303405 RepID=A0A9K3L997_9STRA|nr:hypothetical protein IV203_001829 [Nitzschia inconspicua]KAG7360764.1 hypothetical protein IV203_035863 [Nitzschia inconspicua]